MTSRSIPVTLTAAVLLLSACSPAAATTVSPVAAAPGDGVLAVFLAPASGDPSHYVVSLVRTNGSVAARAQAALRTKDPGTPLPMVSASSSRLYFLDGDSRLKTLSPDGKIAAVRNISGDNNVRVAFAVSPDDRRIAISTIDYGAVPPLLRLSVEDLKGGNRTEIRSSTSHFAWPVAWRQGMLVLAVGDAFPVEAPEEPEHPWCAPELGPCVADNPYAQTHGYEVIDPSSGATRVTLASGQCRGVGLLNRAGVLCREGRAPGGLVTPTTECRPDITTCQRLVDWRGNLTDWTTLVLVWIGAINPSGTRMAGCCNRGGLAIYDARKVGGFERQLTEGVPLWWMDDNHLVHDLLRPGNLHIFTLEIGPDVSVQAPGFPVASIPTGVS